MSLLEAPCVQLKKGGAKDRKVFNKYDGSSLAEVESELVKDAYRHTVHIQCRNWAVEHQGLALAPGLEVGSKSNLLLRCESDACSSGVVEYAYLRY